MAKTALSDQQKHWTMRPLAIWKTRQLLFRNWGLPIELKNDKEFMNLINLYIKTKGILDGKIKETINAGNISNINQSVQRCIKRRLHL